MRQFLQLRALEFVHGRREMCGVKLLHLLPLTFLKNLISSRLIALKWYDIKEQQTHFQVKLKVKLNIVLLSFFKTFINIPTCLPDWGDWKKNCLI